MSSARTKQRGAVALFIVIFAALLITTITVAFVRIMTQNQNQASTIDLSKSALDSAFAGVEDAKRAIVECENSTDPSGDSVCEVLKKDDVGCGTIQETGIAGDTDDDEVLIEQTAGADRDGLLDQAYTCVKITRDAPNYEGRLQSSAPRLVHLKGVDPFDRIVIEWFSTEDLRDSGYPSIDLGENTDLPPFNSWLNNRPPMIRAQLIQFESDSFNLSEFDENEHNATLFLMPSTAGLGPYDFADDKRREPPSRGPEPVICKTESFENFFCSAEIAIQSLIDSSNKGVYLLISGIYNDGNVDFRVELYNGDPEVSPPVNFDGVQYIVDSTGRANDLFRRVESRVELGGNGIPFPEAAVDLDGSLCKQWELTDTAATSKNKC